MIAGAIAALGIVIALFFVLETMTPGLAGTPYPAMAILLTPAFGLLFWLRMRR